MSTVSVTNLKNAASASNNIVLAADGSVSIVGGAVSPYTGMRNRIINGAMTIDQRNAGAATTPAAGVTYLIDRFNLTAQQASKFTFQQVTDAPAGFKNSTKITVAAQYSPAAGDVFYFSQPIEGNNVFDLAFGTASASTITLSLWIKGSVAGTYAASILNGALSRSYIGNITVTTSWAFQTVTFVGDTTGTWATDSSAGMSLNIDLGSGSTFQSTAGSWQAGRFYRTSANVTFVNQANGSTLFITGVQLEKGSTATPFEFRSIGTELALCQRYFELFGNGGVASANAGNATANSGSFKFSVPKRATPTITHIANYTLWLPNVGGYVATTSAISTASTSGCMLGIAVTPSPVTNGAALIYNTSTDNLSASAEL